MGLFDTSDDSSDDFRIENADIDCQPQNDYVTKENVKEIDEYLDPGEKVHYMSKGGALRIEGGSGMELPTVISAATDERVVVGTYMSQGKEGQHSFFYEKISGVGLKAGIIKKKISIQTSAETYTIGVNNLDKEEAGEMADFIREKSNKIKKESNNEDSSRSPIEKIGKLNDLKDAGAISEEEFEEKKSDLMDQI